MAYSIQASGVVQTRTFTPYVSTDSTCIIKYALAITSSTDRPTGMTLDDDTLRQDLLDLIMPLVPNDSTGTPSNEFWFNSNTPSSS